MTTTKPEIGTLLTESFLIWRKTLQFQFLFSLVYFSVLMFAGSYAFRYYGLFEELSKFQNLFYSDFKLFIKKYETLMLSENAQSFAMAILVVKSVIFPLNMGFLKIYRKLDLGEQLEVGDLFAGFRGIYFFVFVFYALFWNLLSIYTSFLILVWIPMMLFVPSLIFFKNYNYFQAFGISSRIFVKNPVLILTVCLASFIVTYSGFLMFVFGLFFTFPFWNAVIYSLYKNLIVDFGE